MGENLIHGKRRAAVVVDATGMAMPREASNISDLHLIIFNDQIGIESF